MKPTPRRLGFVYGDESVVSSRHLSELTNGQRSCPLGDLAMTWKPASLCPFDTVAVATGGVDQNSGGNVSDAPGDKLL